MDSSGERGPTTKTAAEDRRRLLAVGRADPFLVTKLPQNGTVSNGIVQLDGGGILGFAHQPLPEGTRVRVAYQEWLYAERLAVEHVAGEGVAAVDLSEGSAPGKSVLEETLPEMSASKENVPKEDVARSSRAQDGAATALRPDDVSPRTSQDHVGGEAESDAATGSAAQRRGESFPDDLARGGQEVPSVGEDGERKSWTDAFGTGTPDEPERER